MAETPRGTQASRGTRTARQAQVPRGAQVPGGAQASPRPRQSSRGSDTAGGVRFTVVFLGVLAVVVAFFALNRPDPRLPEPVDYETVVEMAQEQYPYQVRAPSSVPDSWRATSVDHSQQPAGNRWRVGFLTGDEEFVGLEQAGGEIQSYLAERLSGFDQDGAVQVRGETWERWEERGGNGDRALVLMEDDAVTVVRGTPAYEVLGGFVRRLD